MIYNELELPLSVKGLIQSVKSYESLTVEASVKRSFNLALLSLINHPLIGQYEKAYPLLLKLLKENNIEFS
jgi:6-phospho-beta-glucosidase